MERASRLAIAQRDESGGESQINHRGLHCQLTMMIECCDVDAVVCRGVVDEQEEVFFQDWRIIIEVWVTCYGIKFSRALFVDRLDRCGRL